MMRCWRIIRQCCPDDSQPDGDSPKEPDDMDVKPQKPPSPTPDGEPPTDVDPGPPNPPSPKPDGESSTDDEDLELHMKPPSSAKPDKPTFDFKPPLPGSDPGLPPDFSPIKQLFSETNYHLAITPDQIVGINERDNPHAVLEIKAVKIGEVCIKGVETGTFVAMDETGKIYAQPDASSKDIVFHEMYEDGWNRYMSKKHVENGHRWFLAIKKSGKMKRGPKTGYYQKSAKFLPVPVNRS